MAGLLDVMIAIPIDEAQCARIAAADRRVRVWYDPGLLPVPAFPGDHAGWSGFTRDRAGERTWGEMLARAEVLLGIPGGSPAGLADAIARGPRLRWIAAISAGAGEQVRAARLKDDALDRVTITTAAGAHAVPLAEFAMFGLLAMARDAAGLARAKSKRVWPSRPLPTGELRDRTLLVLGLGEIGRATARLAAAFGMRVIGVRRHPGEPVDGVAEQHQLSALPKLLAGADAVVAALPSTPETDGVLDAEALDSLPRGAWLVNVGRGSVLDEDALADRLRSGRIGGAALDVFATEPLPPQSPLWRLPNVIVSPHSAALTAAVDERLVDGFVANLHRYLAGAPLAHRVDPDGLY
jgi:glyoxylate/hydroxypyruvate reductase A